MKENGQSLIELCFKKNENCEVYKALERYEVEYDKKLIESVTYHYFNTDSQYKRFLGMLKRYYTYDFMSFEKFLEEIYLTFGGGDVDKGFTAVQKDISYAAKNMIKNIYEYLDYEPKVLDVCRIILLITTFRSYKGFLFESMIKDVLEQNNFIVEETDQLDRKYKIDLLVSLKGYEEIKVGLQLKSYKFEKYSPYKKTKYLQGNDLALEHKVADDIKYLLHSDNLEIFKNRRGVLFNHRLITQGQYCSLFGEEFEVCSIEFFIDELLEVVYEKYLEKTIVLDKFQNCFRDVIIRDRFKKEIGNFKEEQKKCLNQLVAEISEFS
ncbi:MAG: hypothetical protein ACRCTZ_01250 [Sarcina sp.]